MTPVDQTELSLLAMSGIKFPTRSRKYLMDLSAEIRRERGAKLVLLAGDTIDGAELEKELRARVKFERAELRQREREARLAHKRAQEQAKAAASARKEDFVPDPFDDTPFKLNERKFREEFIESIARDFDEFLPKSADVNYHIVIAQKVYEKEIGARILERVQDMRKDMRLLGSSGNGRRKYDAEVKIPVQIKDFGEIRVLVPQRTPWFYEMITGLMQRLINSFTGRTFSPEPSLILVGCAGTSAQLPFYRDVPAISIPTLNKIHEQLSTENAVGPVEVRIVTTGKKQFRVIPRAYDFRPVIARERDLLIPKDTSPTEKLVLQSLRSSAASPNTLFFRMRTAQEGSRGKQTLVSEEAMKEALANLQKRGLVVYRKRSNHWAINEERLGNVQVTLKQLLKNTRVVRHAARSCYHVGSLKTMYRTLIHHFPSRAVDVDAIIENGDPVQGLAHNYEYNGELLPIANGFDKQVLLFVKIVAKGLLDIAKLRIALGRIDVATLASRETLAQLIPFYVINSGNHLDWLYYNKHAYKLYNLVEGLKHDLVEGLMRLCEEHGARADYWTVKEVVEEKIVMVVENHLVSVDGMLIGVKHPSKSRTKTKSHRIQDVVEFLARSHKQMRRHLTGLPKHMLQGFCLVYVANFHEAASVTVTRFGRSFVGVMTGAGLKDTQFEAKQDKVVDYGFALVTACINAQNEMVYSEVEFDNYMDPRDAKLAFADKIMTSDVMKLCKELEEIVDLPWRM